MKQEFISLLWLNSEQLLLEREGRRRIPALGACGTALFREIAKIPFSLQYEPQNIWERIKPLQFSGSLKPELAKYKIMES